MQLCVVRCTHPLQTFTEMDLTKDGVINPEEWTTLVHRNPGQCWGGGRCRGGTQTGRRCDVSCLQGLDPDERCLRRDDARPLKYEQKRRAVPRRRTFPGLSHAACSSPFCTHTHASTLADVISFMTLPVLQDVCLRYPTPNKLRPDGSNSRRQQQ